MRRILAALGFILVYMAFSPNFTHAQGVIFKGHNVTDSKPIQATTGNCVCEDNWYTVGVNAGTMHVKAVLKTYAARLNVPSYAIRIFLYEGAKALQWTQAYCLIKQRHCGHTAQLTVHVTRSTIYYVKVEGPGAEGTQYSLQFQGPLRHLVCHARCV